MPIMSEEKSNNLKTFPIVLKYETSITPNVKHFVFHCTKDDFTYIAGQFITLHIEKEGKILRRSYSLAQTPEQASSTQQVEFAAGYVQDGPASELLFNLMPGDTVTASGPFGRLILKDAAETQPKRYIFVSTSTGVTPFKAMLKTLSERFLAHPEMKVALLEGVQKRQDILYDADFLAFAEKHPQFSFYACYSREEKDNLQPHERSGYVQSIFSELNLNPQEDLVYLCGNPGMIDEAFLALKEKEFDVRSIYREKYISAK